jgi:hypothetical protein
MMTRHRFHSICPYFAMFPETFVQKHLIWSKPGDLVLDPFSGRGTTVFEALLNHREAIGGDTNPVAVCVSRAKADPPNLGPLLERIAALSEEVKKDNPAKDKLERDEFFTHCFAPGTLRQLLSLRRRLKWKASRVDRFIAALALGCLHGESHRTPWCFSNRMPRTISTKPAYSVAWWKKNRCAPPERDVFFILREVARYRYESPLPGRRGRVAAVDARRIATRFPDALGRVSLMVTSPPYLDTTNYREDQWLRLWFLGGKPHVDSLGAKSDDRHRGADSYWKFLTAAWKGVAPLLRDGAHLLIRIGGRHIDPASAEKDLRDGLKSGLDTRVRLVDRRSSKILNGQLHAFRPGVSGTQIEHDFHFRIA